jgi:hypothetical protein
VATLDPTRERSAPGTGAVDLERRALALWPALDRAALGRCHNDPRNIASLVARHTALPPEAIASLLAMPRVDDADIGTWFG